jgi:hypothetical protein
VAWAVPTAVDNVNGAVPVTCSRSSSVFPLGVTNISCWAADSARNNVSCSFSVTVVDNTPPVVSCPNNSVVMSLLSINNITWAVPNATDNTGLVETQISTSSIGPLCSTGVICSQSWIFTPETVLILTFTARDVMGMSSSCQWTVYVLPEIDITPPTFATGCTNATAVYNITAQVASSASTVVVSWPTPTLTDDRPGIIGLQLSSVPEGFGISGRSFSVGLYAMNYTAIDAAGNKAFCLFNVVVTDPHAPTLTGCTASRFLALSVTTDPSRANATVTLGASCSTSNCFQAITAADNVGVLSSRYLCDSGAGLQPCTFPLVLPVGSVRVVYEAYDASLNLASCEGAIVVRDLEPPVFGGCVSIVVVSDPNSTQAFLPCPEVTVSDNVAVASIVQASVLVPGVDCNASVSIGTRALSYRAWDAVNNTAVCNITIGVNDGESPVFTNCPTAPLVFETESFSNSTVVAWNPIGATDNSGSVTLTYSPAITNTTRFQFGVHSVVLRATDTSGIMATCSFLVSIVDRQRPVFLNCPSNSTYTHTFVNYTLPQQAVGMFTLPSITATDNVRMRSQQFISALSRYPAGVATLVSYQAIDTSDNSDVCSFNVYIQDNQVPTIMNCPTGQTFRCPTSNRRDTGPCVWPAITATDNIPAGLTIGYSSSPTGFTQGSLFRFGRTNMTFFARDAAGNENSCDFSIEIFDVENPVFTSCPSAMVVKTNATDSIYADVVWSDITAADNVGVVTLVSSNTTGASTPLTHSPQAHTRLASTTSLPPPPTSPTTLPSATSPSQWSWCVQHEFNSYLRTLVARLWTRPPAPSRARLPVRARREGSLFCSLSL